MKVKILNGVSFPRKIEYNSDVFTSLLLIMSWEESIVRVVVHTFYGFPNFVVDKLLFHFENQFTYYTY
jgi:hypothetical protein